MIFSNVPIAVSSADKVSLVRKSVCTLIKMISALFWQEHAIKGFYLYSKFWNRFAGEMMPYVNKFANLIGGWEYGT